LSTIRSPIDKNAFTHFFLIFLLIIDPRNILFYFLSHSSVDFEILTGNVALLTVLTVAEQRRTIFFSN
jgi:hypothetical protein